ncbi:uncharacterized protein L203_102763 [Cryptococcus depauperatus CBS 7841]|uniref:Uncharacterized protein n=1 Tax=Cryptococcus depauperatus CBS 7841 TaxID=1295531 RepID=A0AAJ8M043_9TREE
MKLTQFPHSLYPFFFGFINGTPAAKPEPRFSTPVIDTGSTCTVHWGGSYERRSFSGSSRQEKNNKLCITCLLDDGVVLVFVDWIDWRAHENGCKVYRGCSLVWVEPFVGSRGRICCYGRGYRAIVASGVV